jgi:hypothetical protein
MSTASARYWINKAEGDTTLEQASTYALLAQAEAMLAIAEALKIFLTMKKDAKK